MNVETFGEGDECEIVETESGDWVREEGQWERRLKVLCESERVSESVRLVCVRKRVSESGELQWETLILKKPLFEIES